MAEALENALREEIATLAADLGMDKRQAFAAWYAQQALGLQPPAALEAVACWAADDKGIDLIHLDHGWKRLVLSQVEYAPEGQSSPPSPARLTVLLNRITELADLAELRAAGQSTLITAGQRLRRARSRGYAIELQLVYLGPRDEELDRLARSFNRRNLRDDVSVAIVSGAELVELKRQRVRSVAPTRDAQPAVDEELIEETAALGSFDGDRMVTMPIPRGESLEDAFEDETITGSYELQPTTGDGPQAVLVVQAGSRLGEMMRIGGAIVIGRSARASCRIDDAGISREHCSIARSGEGKFSLADLKSRNGTFVNGRRVKRAILRDGDKIRIGAATVLKFTLADEIDETFQQRMYDAALRDPLTGLYNRRHLMEQLEKEFAFVQRHGTPLSLVLLDIDHFKSLNDTRGHLVGDTVLRGVAHRLQAAIRKEDLAARHGGDEFAILCRDAGADVVQIAARRVLGLIRQPEIVPEDPEFTVSACLGLASTPHPQLADHLALFEAADEALYRAKRAGRNRLCVFGRGESGEFS